jgi:hypothetical protein
MLVKPPMHPLKSLTKGFFAATTTIAFLSIIELARNGNPTIALVLLLTLIIPLTYGIYLWHRKKGISENTDVTKKLGNILFALQGAAIACWIFDLATTFYAIDLAKIAYEINPLGWPFGALGALTYYGPTITLSYILIYRFKQKISIYVAIPITFVAFCMGAMNLRAGINNFGFFVETANIPSIIGINLISALVVLDLVYGVFFVRAISKRFLPKFQKFDASKKN